MTQAQSWGDAPFFGSLSPHLAALGWCVFPETRDGRPGPGSVDGVPIRMPDAARPDEVARWALACPNHNVACVLGAASGDVLAVDVDAPDAGLAAEIRQEAERVLGPTPFQLVAGEARVLMLYRQAPADPQVARIASRAWRFAEGDAGAGHGVGILSDGRHATFYGPPHQSGRPHRWLDAQPCFAGPAEAPVVDHGRVMAFVDAVSALRTLDGAAS
jgi:hypothetical protein